MTQENLPTAAAANTSLVDIRAQLEAEAKALGERIKQPAGAKIRVTDGHKFRLPDGTEHDGPLSVVIVDFVAANRYYDSDFQKDSKEYSPPACFAIGFAENDKLTPSAASPDKQSKGCKECPNNEFGSKGRGKACDNRRLLAVVAGEGDDAADPGSKMYILDLSPTNLKEFDSYAASVRLSTGLSPIGVVTDIYVDKDAKNGVKFGNPRANTNLQVHFGRREEAKALLTREPDVSKYVPPKKAGVRTRTK